VVRIPSAFADTLLSIVALAVLIAILAAVNEPFRQELTDRVTGASAEADAARLVHGAREAVSALVIMAKDQTADHATLVIFVIAAVVLVVFMLRM